MVLATISSEAQKWERSTTIPQGSTAKWPEAPDRVIGRYSLSCMETCSSESDMGLTTPCEYERWVTDSLGGYMYSDELSNVLRRQAQPLSKFRQFQDAKDFLDKGLQRGQLFTWDVYSNIATQGTTLVETNTMPESNFTIH